MADDVQHTPRSTLPDRHALKLAIEPWWKGGPTAERIIDLLRRALSDLTEARAVGERLSGLQVRYSFLTDEMIEGELEKVRVIASASPTKSTIDDHELRRRMVTVIQDIARRLGDARNTTPEFQMAAVVSTCEANMADSIGVLEAETYWRQMADVARSLLLPRRVMA